MRSEKIALVTGASSGFGQLTASLLTQGGFHVFGTSRKHISGSDGVDMLTLDVTSPTSVDACVRAVLARCDRIDVLVNNAGQTHASMVEETPIEAAMDVFATNFWGIVRMTNAFLPTMRRQRAGLIINVSSLAGLVGVPGQAFYAASKHALEGYSETLQTELRQFNIGVSLIEPGFFRTNLHHSMLRDGHHIPDYDSIRARIEAVLYRAMSEGGDPRVVAERITSVAQTRRPKLRYRVGVDATWVPRMRAFLPERWFMAGMRRRFGVESKAS
jgi:NAD(P)-dependent dehydrogenase (short-subunit alcohol dehydrogenase family)